MGSSTATRLRPFPGATRSGLKMIGPYYPRVEATLGFATQPLRGCSVPALLIKVALQLESIKSHKLTPGFRLALTFFSE
jgi:hypothetical protein